MQSPACDFTSTRWMAGCEGRSGLPESLQWRQTAGGVQARQEVSPEAKTQLNREVFRIRKDMAAHDAEMASKAAASVSYKVAKASATTSWS